MHILEKYREYAGACTDAPSVYHEYCALAALAAILGRRVYFRLGPNTVFPHIWACLVGPSSVAKKTTAIGIARRLVGKVNENAVLPAGFTVEKLYDICSERPTGLISYNEFDLLLSLMRREYNVELKSTLTDWFDSPYKSCRSTKGGGEVAVHKPSVSILSGSTSQWLVDSVKKGDVRGGFYPRWLFTVVAESDREAMALPPPLDVSAEAEVVNSSRDLLREYMYDEGPAGECRLDPSAEAEFSSIYAANRKRFSGDELMSPFAQRGQVYILKIAMLESLSRCGRTLLDRASVEYGWSVVERCIDGVKGLIRGEIADNPSEARINKLCGLLRQAGQGGLTMGQLLRKGPVKTKRYLRDLLDSIAEMGNLEVVHGKEDHFIWVGE